MTISSASSSTFTTGCGWKKKNCNPFLISSSSRFQSTIKISVFIRKKLFEVVHLHSHVSVGSGYEISITKINLILNPILRWIRLEHSWWEDDEVHCLMGLVDEAPPCQEDDGSGDWDDVDGGGRKDKQYNSQLRPSPFYGQKVFFYFYHSPVEKERKNGDKWAKM